MKDDLREERRLALLAAARDTIVRFGYRKMTLDDVARAAGVSRPTLYNYFENKQQLTREIIVHEIDAIRAVLVSSLDPALPPEERLVAYVRARYAKLRQLRQLYSVVLEVAREVMPVAMAEMDAFRREQALVVQGILDEGITSGRFDPVDSEMLSAALLSSFRGIDEGFMFEDQDALGAAAELLVSTLCTGLVAR